MIIRLLSIILNLLFHFLQFTAYFTCGIKKPALLIIAGHYFYIAINQRFKKYYSHIWQTALTHTKGKMPQISTKKKAARLINRQVFRMQALEAISLFCIPIRLPVTNLISLMANIRINISIEFKFPLIFQPFSVKKNKDDIVWLDKNITQFIHAIKTKVGINEEVENLALIRNSKTAEKYIIQQK